MKAKYIRNGMNISNIETGDTKTFDSVNKAKKESRRLQEADGGLGRGSLIKMGFIARCNRPGESR